MNRSNKKTAQGLEKLASKNDYYTINKIGEKKFQE